MQFKDKLFISRKKSGLTQSELAEKLNVSRQAISKWETGTAVPDIANMLSLSKIFNVTIDYLANDDIETEHYIPTANTTATVFKFNYHYIIFKAIIAVILISALLVIGFISRTFASMFIFTTILGFIFLVYHGLLLLMLFYSKRGNKQKN